MSQQQQQTKLKPIRPTEIGKMASKLGMGKPIKAMMTKGMNKKSIMKGMPKRNSSPKEPSYNKVAKSVKRTMGY